MIRQTAAWACVAAIFGSVGARADGAAKYPVAGVGQGGSVGLGRVVSADTGDVSALRLGLRGAFFQGSEIPTAGTMRQLLGELTLGYTFEPGLEVYGAY